MTELSTPTVSHEDQDGVRWLRIEAHRLGWTIDAKALKARLMEAIDGADRVAVDFERVAYLASPTIGTVLAFNRDATAAGCVVVFCGMQPYVRDTFEALGLDTVLSICDRKDDVESRLNQIE